MEPFPNKDIATEVLSRLPTKSLMAFRCTAKRWNSFISNPSFLRIHYERSILGLVGQNSIPSWMPNLGFADMLTLSELCTPNDKILDFLPEKVVPMASSNGILCCRSWIDHNKWKLKLELKGSQMDFAIYICNPLKREWVQFRSEGGEDATLFFGLAFYPFCSSSGAVSKFKLVNLQHASEINTYSFVIYSSETRKWEMSKEVCMVSSQIYPRRVIFTNGWLHWLTTDHHIVTFHVEKELSKVIKLPDETPYQLTDYTFGIYWCESEGYFNYVYAYGSALRVWVLKDYEESAWELKHYLNLYEFCKQHSSLLKINFATVITRTDGSPKIKFHPLAFHNDVLYIWIQALHHTVISYNFKTKKLINHPVTPQLKGRLYYLPVSLVPLRLSSFRVRKGKNRKRKAL